MIVSSGVRCKACGIDARFLCETPNEHSATSVLHHYSCPNCGLVFVGDYMSDEELQEAYAGLDFAAYYREVETETRRKMQKSIADLERLLDRQQKIIEIGTGNGMFIRMLHEQGFANVYGHEIPGIDLQELEQLGCTIYYDFDYTTVPAETFDAVTLLDVAEHVRAPAYLFQACHRILKPGGIIYLHTPVVSRLDQVFHFIFRRLPPLHMLARTWQRSRTSVFHLQNYTRDALTRLLREAGFHDIDIRLENELSWPVQRYVRIYICEKVGLPVALAPILTPFFYPLLKSSFFNANKAIASARKQ